MSANAAVLVPPMVAVINAAWTARAKVDVFMLCVLDVLNSPPRRRESSARAKRTDAIGVKRRSGQDSRGLVGRWTDQAVPENVVRDQVRAPDRVPQRECGGLGGSRLGRLQEAHRNQRAV